jgi:hypothetical protein
VKGAALSHNTLDDSTSGYISFIGRKDEANAPLVDILLESSTVIDVRTNVPLTLMVSGLACLKLQAHKVTCIMDSGLAE